MLVLVLLVGAGDAVVEAGTAYRQAQAAMGLEKYEEAVTLLRGAAQKLGEESDELKYRDDESRRRHSYYPYYEWGRARLLQARQEPSIFSQRDMIAEAVGRLGQSRHPDASAKLEDAKLALAVVQEAIALDASFGNVKNRVELLGNSEKFVEALKALDAASVKFLGRKKELEEVRLFLKEKQVAVLKRYEQMLTQRLSDVVLMDPATAGDRIAPLLRGALVPADVTEEPGTASLWVGRFVTLWEKELDTVRKAAELPGGRVIASTGALDAAGLEAMTAKLPAGFRATRHLAQAGRMAKLREISSGTEDVMDTKTAAAVVLAATESSKLAGKAASGLAAKDVKEPLLNDLAAHDRQVADVARKIEAGAKERERLTAPILRAEELLADGDTVGDAEALAKLKNDLFELGSDGAFGTLTAALRARAMFAHGLAEAMLAFMEGKTLEQVAEKARLPMWRAYGFDLKVDGRWTSRVSPKMLKVFDKIRPQE